MTENKIEIPEEINQEQVRPVLDTSLELQNIFLRRTTNEVEIQEDSLNEIVELSIKMIKFIHQKGLGLSANQVGYTHSMFVFFYINKWELVVNPRMFPLSGGKSHMKESCLSVPESKDNMIKTVRYNKIRIVYQTIKDGKWKQVAKELSGLPAVIFQHEFDHLQGKLISDFKGENI